MVANQPTLCTTVSGSQLRAAMAARAATPARSLATAHFLRAGVAQQRFGLCDLVGSRRDEDAKAIVGEARIVEDRSRSPRRQPALEQNAQNRVDRPAPNRHLDNN